MKRLFVFCLVALMWAGLLVTPGSAAQLESLLVNLLSADQEAAVNDYNDSSPFSIVYKGTGTGCTLTITSATLVIDATADDASDVSINTNATSYDTWGEVYDYLKNYNGNVFGMTETDMRRAEDCDYLGNIATEDIDGITYAVLLDTGGINLSGAGAGLFTIMAINPGAKYSVRLFRALGCADIASAGSIKIYKESYPARTEELVWDQAMEDGATKETTLTFGVFAPFSGWDFSRGERIIIKSLGDEIQDATAAAPSRVEAYWLAKKRRNQ